MARRQSGGGEIILLLGAAAGLLWSLFKYPIPTIIGINVMTLIFWPDNFGTVLGYSVVALVIYLLVKNSKKQAEQSDAHKSIEQKYGARNVNQNLSLIERNEDIIKKNLGSLRIDTWPYYVENKVRDCLIDITTAEGKKQFSPTQGEYLRNWSGRPGLPKEWLDLKESILLRFKDRFSELKSEQKKLEEQSEREEKIKQDKEGQKFFEKNQDLINKFFEIAERKVSIIDDYGDENWGVLPTEIDACIIKIAQRNGASSEDIKDFFKKGYVWKLGNEYAWLREKLDTDFRTFHQEQKNKPSRKISIEGLSGVEFESYVAKVLKENGYSDVRGTPATGDQGADLIVKHRGKTIVIQAKRYQGTVGNRAVQEVVSAVQFYGANEGWVVTNSTFTPSARALAQRSMISLIDGRTLEKIDEFLQRRNA